jgi:hypothetical protein
VSDYSKLAQEENLNTKIWTAALEIQGVKHRDLLMCKFQVVLEHTLEHLPFQRSQDLAMYNHQVMLGSVLQQVTSRKLQAAPEEPSAPAATWPRAFASPGLHVVEVELEPQESGAGPTCLELEKTLALPEVGPCAMVVVVELDSVIAAAVHSREWPEEEEAASVAVEFAPKTFSPKANKGVAVPRAARTVSVSC